MEWAALIISALTGGVVATLFGELLRTRRAYRTALLLVAGELSENAIWVGSAKAPAGAPFKTRMFEPGWFRTRAWDEHSQFFALRMYRLDSSFYGELASLYAVMKPMAATGEEPPEALAADLDDLKQRLFMFDPTMLTRLMLRLLRTPRTRRLAIALASVAGDAHEIRAVVDSLSDEAESRRSTS